MRRRRVPVTRAHAHTTLQCRRKAGQVLVADHVAVNVNIDPEVIADHKEQRTVGCIACRLEGLRRRISSNDRRFQPARQRIMVGEVS